MNWLRSRRRAVGLLFSVLALIIIVEALSAPASAADRHAGYYYPAVVTSEETYTARAAIMTQASRELRIQFIINITQQLLGKPYAPDYIIFAKGDQAEKMIIVGLNDNGGLSTLFRARATLAMLTNIARRSNCSRNGTLPLPRSI
ncbi:MAG: molybdopterin-guanine dinucleotide biosynthesis protein A [Alphaproteobacteria bacterium]|nr:molybdopterin-guanine dinucleotide biosynthesis protein A [Alphaproteobacteria bacterium]